MEKYRYIPWPLHYTVAGMTSRSNIVASVMVMMMHFLTPLHLRSKLAGTIHACLRGFVCSFLIHFEGNHRPLLAEHEARSYNDHLSNHEHCKIHIIVSDGSAPIVMRFVESISFDDSEAVGADGVLIQASIGQRLAEGFEVSIDYTGVHTLSHRRFVLDHVELVILVVVLRQNEMLLEDGFTCIFSNDLLATIPLYMIDVTSFLLEALHATRTLQPAIAGGAISAGLRVFPLHAQERVDVADEAVVSLVME